VKPLDLRNAPPRSCYVELDGLMLMPRTIDKLRSRLPGGEPGNYFISLGRIKGISAYLIERLGITEEALFDAVTASESDDDVAAWLRKNTDASQYPVINETLRRIKPKHTEDQAFFRELYADTLALHPELQIIIDIVDADDRRLFGANR
jgi:hypothetical protein